MDALLLFWPNLGVLPENRPAMCFVLIALVGKTTSYSSNYTIIVSSQPTLARATSFPIRPIQTSYLAAIFHFKAS